MSTDDDWEKWGANNPYYGVLSDKKFYGKELNKSEYQEFYHSGEYEIEGVVRKIEAWTNTQNLKFSHAVDFGCGVGRLTMALARHSKKVTGLDVSPSMIKKAISNMPAKYRSKINYVVSDDNLQMLPGDYDLVYSNIVLQHIPVYRAMKIINVLLKQLDKNGFAALHVTYKHDMNPTKKMIIRLREHFIIIHYLFNVFKNRPYNTPLMRMHLYDLSKVMELFRTNNLKHLNTEFTDHGGYIGIMIIGQKD
jgi:2-polyprenyl-3-methyl-5-hydroxy-6-metoxy-1,4-benzoquinol methylase